MVSKEEITPETTLEEILKIPGVETLMAKYRIPCFSCPFARQEMSLLTLEQISKAYGIDLAGFLKEANQSRKKTPRTPV